MAILDDNEKKKNNELIWHAQKWLYFLIHIFQFSQWNENSLLTQDNVTL